MAKTSHRTTTQEPESPLCEAGSEHSGGILRRGLLKSLEGVTWSMPVWVPLLLLFQIGTRGLNPALAEGQRLDLCEVELEQRLSGSLERRAELESERAALDDPMYIERLKRARDGR